ncbi:AraC family transcriptional regulator [Brucella pituitosa]|nr:AraC family transcriptional regulator [Brucella pituitosa]
MDDRLEFLNSARQPIDYEKIRILMTSEHLQWENLSVYVAEITPYEVHFPSSEQLVIGMAIDGYASGNLRTKHDAIHLAFPNNRIIVFPIDNPCIASFDRSFKMTFICISKSIVEDVFNGFSHITGSYFDLGRSISFSDQYIETAIELLAGMLSSSKKEHELEASYIVRAMLARIASKYAFKLSSCQPIDCFLPRMQSALIYIENNLHRYISLSQFAKEVGLGEAQYARLFKRTMNTTFHQYVINRRVEKARRLLTETNMPAAEIACECGFADQVHLTRFFKKIIGATPIKYRRAAQI